MHVRFCTPCTPFRCPHNPLSVTSASSADIQSTIQSAHHTFQSGQWSKAPAVHRSKVLTRIARALEQRVPDFARIETLQTGRTLREMNAQLGRLPEWLYVVRSLRALVIHV